jgi:hypothetical protein
MPCHRDAVLYNTTNRIMQIHAAQEHSRAGHLKETEVRENVWFLPAILEFGTAIYSAQEALQYGKINLHMSFLPSFIHQTIIYYIEVWCKELMI